MLTNTLQADPAGGRQLLCHINHDALRCIFGSGLLVHELPQSRLVGARSVANAFRGHLDGLDAGSAAGALARIRDERVGKVLVDGSNLGEFARLTKRHFPDVEVTTFFHNVEARFFLGSLRQVRSPRALAVLVANYLAERKAVRYSDKIICLSERDSRLLKKLYGRGATHISAMAVRRQKVTTDTQECVKPGEEPYLLFVGGGFYANQGGIEWFVRNVVPRIAVKTCIVGRGFDGLKAQLEQSGRVEVVGAVDDLAPWYLNARHVIAPIFDGSGMKTKVAEALMFGKQVIGTPEAFSGYEDIADRAGVVCATADEFVAAIEQGGDFLDAPGDDEKRRNIYEERYSFGAAQKRLEAILNAPTER
ncbi:glycosyltransferase [uncultured Thiodictyon sp.]|uniref:glycosyltransferase n=1 Tax=uncultured Thiodictyon sp. TaxID=1846217 RepID=UPI0025DA04E2|nr:glycosyltransferase [uncultured Thiodictyon sp.]